MEEEGNGNYRGSREEDLNRPRLSRGGEDNDQQYRREYCDDGRASRPVSATVKITAGASRTAMKQHATMVRAVRCNSPPGKIKRFRPRMLG